MKKIIFLLIFSMSTAISIAQTYIPFVADKGTITNVNQQIIPNNIGTSGNDVYIDVVKERLGNAVAKAGVEGWIGQNSWTFPVGYPGSSS